MGSDVRHVRGEAQKELVKKFEVFSSNGRSRWQVWSDWITMSAIAVSNATDRSHFDEREKQYLSIAGKYTRPEMEAFTEMLALLVVALEDNPEQDFLGELYIVTACIVILIMAVLSVVAIRFGYKALLIEWAIDAISKAEKEFVGTKLGEARLAVVVSWLREKVPAPVRFLVTDDLIRKAVQTAFDAAKSGLEVLKNA